ncbi:hypothetical protein HN415_04515 [Candidatus Woesearchaeota archaeon]|nr:hypothetical protein [Candidatus Woesearchaeota archaeon]
MIIAQILFFIITIALIVWFIKSSESKNINTPKKILDNRLASGEINNKQYDSLLKKIQKEV